MLLYGQSVVQCKNAGRLETVDAIAEGEPQTNRNGQTAPTGWLAFYWQFSALRLSGVRIGQQI